MDWMASPQGLAVDRVLVRYTGHSLLNHVFARQADMEPRPALLLRTRGRRTGLWREAVLPWFYRDGARLVVGSRGGLPRDPGWAVNLRADPAAEIVVNRSLQFVEAEFLEGVEYQRAWEEVASLVPVYREYRRRCEGQRQIPLVRLVPA